jgi:type I restriction enzyme S subunit
MSKLSYLEKLLNEAGVEWKPLGDNRVGEFIRGGGLQKKDFTETGVGCIHYGQIYTHYGIYADKTKTFVSEEFAKKARKAKSGDLVIATTSENDEDVCKAVAWLGKEDIAVSSDACIYRHNLNPKYVSYFFQTEQFQKQKRPYITGTKVRRVNADDLSKIPIPIPCPENQKKSLAIQAEIVRILDAFTQLTAELTAELTARKKQYDYYREQLLTFEDGEVEWKPLEDVCSSISAGGDLPENYAKGQIQPSDEFPYPIYANATGEKGLYGFTDGYKIENDAVTISARGAKIGYHTVREGKFTPIIRLITLVPNKSVTSTRYLNYILDMTSIGGTDGGIPQLTVPTVKKISVPIPSLAKQNRIVNILNKFDTLTTSLSEGLPHEIELRQKQYEYYRDLLLNFPKPEEKQYG